MINTYNTKLLNSDTDGIEEAAELLRQGKVVGIPTETVYGLAADAANAEAVAEIFKAKGRPADNPLIVHIAEASDIERYAENIPGLAYRLAGEFWAGPLTMVLKKRSSIPGITSGGLDTIGLRLPEHETAVKLIKACGFPLAAPSANLSGSPSPTCAMHVYDDMNGKIPAIIDGGNCPVGVESTVISFENDGIRLLRPGFVSVEDFEAAGIAVYYDKGIVSETAGTEKALSPGMKYRHYSPKAKVTVVSGSADRFIEFMGSKCDDGTYAMVFDDCAADYPYKNFLTYGNTPEEQAERLFSVLRRFDGLSANKVYAMCPERDGVGLAVYNRLIRAAGFKVLEV